MLNVKNDVKGSLWQQENLKSKEDSLRSAKVNNASG
jgi:hypothetical protein